MSAATFDDRLREVESDTRSNSERIVAHEMLCAERYKNIGDSIGSIKSILQWAGGALVVGMAGILVRLVFFPA